METLLFVAFVAVFGLIIFLPIHKSKQEKELQRRHSVKKAVRQSDLLTQPANHLMAHRHELWQERKKKVNRTGVEEQDFIPKFEKGENPEYDGYSRRGRHHLTPTADCKKHQKHEEEFEMTAVKFEPDPDLKPASGSGNG